MANGEVSAAKALSVTVRAFINARERNEWSMAIYERDMYDALERYEKAEDNASAEAVRLLADEEEKRKHEGFKRGPRERTPREPSVSRETVPTVTRDGGEIPGTTWDDEKYP